MDASHLQDRLYWGLNRTANILGRLTDAYRPHGVTNPLERTNRYLQLPAAFSRADGNFGQSIGYGMAVWRGHFDASYTRPGDYLVQKSETWFIGTQQSLLPVMCIKTNRIISVTRQSISPAGSSYDLKSSNSTISIISNWPASVLGIGAEGKSPTRLPGDTTVSSTVVLVPSIHEQIIQPTDMIIDEYGMTSIVVAAEQSDFGWRLNVRHVST